MEESRRLWRLVSFWQNYIKSEHTQEHTCFTPFYNEKSSPRQVVGCSEERVQVQRVLLQTRR